MTMQAATDQHAMLEKVDNSRMEVAIDEDDLCYQEKVRFQVQQEQAQTVK